MGLIASAARSASAGFTSTVARLPTTAREAVAEVQHGSSLHGIGPTPVADSDAAPGVNVTCTCRQFSPALALYWLRRSVTQAGSDGGGELSSVTLLVELPVVWLSS